jgi:hypothetical protein
MGYGGTACNLRKQEAAEDVVHVGPEAIAPRLDQQEAAAIAGRFPGAASAVKAAQDLR